MKVFDLGCENDHRFEGWFSSAEDFDRQKQQSLLECPLCGSHEVNRLLSAARINTGKARETGVRPDEVVSSPGQYTNFDAAQALKVLSQIIQQTEDVGKAFPEEARRIHYQESPQRHIRGTASPQEVESLREEGIDVVALPVPPHLANKSH
jgi:hypothetical protein